MAIRVQHQGAGAGSGVNTDSNFKRKYDYQIKQQEKLQDRMFQVGMQDRSAAMRRQEMIIGNNLQDNQRRQAREDAQIDLKERREFDAKLRGEERQNKLADIENNRAFNMEQQDRQFEMQQFNRQQGMDDEQSARARLDRINRATSRGAIKAGFEMGEYDGPTQRLLQDTLDQEDVILSTKLEDDEREEAMAQLMARRVMLMQRKQDKVVEPPRPIPVQEAFQDPKVAQQYLTFAQQILSQDGMAQPDMDTVLEKALELYQNMQNPDEFMKRRSEAKAKADAAGGLAPPVGVGAPQAGAAPGVVPATGGSQAQSPPASAATGSMNKSDGDWLPSYSQKPVDWMSKLPEDVGKSYAPVLELRDALLKEYEQYQANDEKIGKEKGEIAHRGRYKNVPTAELEESALHNAAPQDSRLAAQLIDLYADPTQDPERQHQAYATLKAMGIDLFKMVGDRKQPAKGVEGSGLGFTGQNRPAAGGAWAFINEKK